LTFTSDDSGAKTAPRMGLSVGGSHGNADHVESAPGFFASRPELDQAAIQPESFRKSRPDTQTNADVTAKGDEHFTRCPLLTRQPMGCRPA